MRKAPILLLTLLALPAGGLAQSLGEVAAQEKARREKEKAKQTGKKPRSVKTFTDEDLQSGASREKTTEPPPEEPFTPSSPSSPGTEGSEREEDSGPKAEWRQRATQFRQAVETARQRVSSLSEDVERIKQDLNPMSLTYREDVNTILRLQSELTQAQARVEEANQQVAAAEKAYQEFGAEARHAGVPPSWLE